MLKKSLSLPYDQESIEGSEKYEINQKKNKIPTKCFTININYDILYPKSIERPVYHYIYEPKNSTFDNAKRIISIAFNYDKNTGVVYYGSSIFTRVKPKECCIKKNIIKTATKRFYENPVSIVIDTNIIKPNNFTVQNVSNQIRIAMFTFGCKNKKFKIEDFLKDDDKLSVSISEIESDKYIENDDDEKYCKKRKRFYSFDKGK